MAIESKPVPSQNAPYKPGHAPRGWSAGVLLALFGGIGVLLLICCGGMTCGMYGLGYAGLAVETQVAAEVMKQTPVFRQHIGEIQKLRPNLFETATNTDGAIVFDVRGDRGSACSRWNLIRKTTPRSYVPRFNSPTATWSW